MGKELSMPGPDDHGEVKINCGLWYASTCSKCELCIMWVADEQLTE